MLKHVSRKGEQQRETEPDVRKREKEGEKAKEKLEQRQTQRGPRKLAGQATTSCTRTNTASDSEK